MSAVFRHELSGYFHSLTAYLYAAFLLVFVGVGAMLYNIQSAVANFEYVLRFVCLGFVIIIPVLTMRIIAEERKQKTDQLLYSLPLSTAQVVVGKYLALVAVYLLPLLIICFYPIIFAQFGEVYLPTSYGSLFAFFMMGAAFIAIGMFISSLTDSVGFAAGITALVVLLNYYSVTLAEYVSATAMSSLIALLIIIFLFSLLIRHLIGSDLPAFAAGGIIAAASIAAYVINSGMFEGLLANIMKQLSLFERFYKFVNGVFDITGIVYYVTVIAFFLFLCVQSLEKRRYN